MVFRVDIVLSPAINDPGLRDQNLISSPANGLCHSLIWRTEREQLIFFHLRNPAPPGGSRAAT